MPLNHQDSASISVDIMAVGKEQTPGKTIKAAQTRRNFKVSASLTLTPPTFVLHSMPFGEVVCGSPGSGKSTYCYGKYQLFTALKRPISVVNLDPANDALPYPCAIDISALITLQDVMDKHGLGPNGAMLYCMEYLEANFDWLEARLAALGDDAYVLFDLPGQVELSTNHESIKHIVDLLTKRAFRVRPFPARVCRR